MSNKIQIKIKSLDESKIIWDELQVERKKAKDILDAIDKKIADNYYQKISDQNALIDSLCKAYECDNFYINNQLKWPGPKLTKEQITSIVKNMSDIENDEDHNDGYMGTTLTYNSIDEKGHTINVEAYTLDSCRDGRLEQHITIDGEKVYVNEIKNAPLCVFPAYLFINGNWQP
jgi:hypothetical protein